MSTILNLRANSQDSKCFKSTHFKNTDWVVHGNPQYNTSIHPSTFNDSFFLDTNTWIESPADSIFNLHNKNFTITWWEYNLGDQPTETASIVFSTGDIPSNSNTYLLLNRNLDGKIWTKRALDSTSWTVDINATPPPINAWVNCAFMIYNTNNSGFSCEFYINGINTNSNYSRYPLPDVGNDGKMFMGQFSNTGSERRGPNKYMQNIRFYNEALFLDEYNNPLNAYNVADYEKDDKEYSILLNSFLVESI